MDSFDAMETTLHCAMQLVGLGPRTCSIYLKVVCWLKQIKSLCFWARGTAGRCMSSNGVFILIILYCDIADAFCPKQLTVLFSSQL